MHTKARKSVARYLLLIALLVISCDLSSLVAPAGPIPTPVPGAVDTIVAQTAAAAWTQTAANITVIPTWTATDTPVPTDTPTPTLSPTQTFIFVLASLTPTRKPTATNQATISGFGCELLSQSPEDGTHFAAKKSFNVSWTIKNTGDNPWDSGSVDFEYLSGTKMFTGTSIYDLPNDVDVNAKVKLTVPMAAPKNPGDYRTVWTLRLGKNDFCHVDLRILVP